MATEKSKEILHYREQGLGYKKIAALTGYSLNTVKSTPDGLQNEQKQ